jgi:hypothetical protein
MRSGGFFAGAVAGLAIALLVVGAASILPQTSSPLKTASPQAAAQSVTTTVSTKALATSSATNGSAQFISAPPGAQNAAIGAPPSTTTAPSAGAGAASNLSAVSNQAQTGATAAGGTQGQQKPGSLLAVLPGESAARVIATVSPLLVGLLVAALVYGAYARRQDSSS